MVFKCINIRQVSWEVLKTAAFGLGFQHLPRDLANVNVWKTMFDPYIHVVTGVLTPASTGLRGTRFSENQIGLKEPKEYNNKH